MWSNDHVEPSKGSCLVTDWDMFHNQDISIEEITDYFRTSDVIVKEEF